jgi:hypothetical protein
VVIEQQKPDDEKIVCVLSSDTNAWNLTAYFVRSCSDYFSLSVVGVAIRHAVCG